MKPDWKNAPEWAKFLVQNESGRRYWHEHIPHMPRKNKSSSIVYIKTDWNIADLVRMDFYLLPNRNGRVMEVKK